MTKSVVPGVTSACRHHCAILIVHYGNYPPHKLTKHCYGIKSETGRATGGQWDWNVNDNNNILFSLGSFNHQHKHLTGQPKETTTSFHLLRQVLWSKCAVGHGKLDHGVLIFKDKKINFE